MIHNKPSKKLCNNLIFIIDISHFKGMDDLTSKGNDLDYLAQLNSMPATRRLPVGASSQGMHSSPLHLIIGSPIKEEDEPQDVELKARRPYIKKTDLRENFKQPAKSSNAEHIHLNASPVPVSWTPEANERTGNLIQPQFKQDVQAYITNAASPKLSTSISKDIASSLSEKIADSLTSEKSGAPLTSVQINFIRNMIEETLEDFR
ncbi:hypothetical protein AB205_0198100 [Aquarana catesbeiana]|uniref:Uncharacterized protein n=1 Tax=Aquarana catesbeiana TaxID=8400 RepID=A0A2G9RLF9_AQUCT|nr:hypothetical protein AB205_0198100 [Aquarana catesbeiana]